ncbi:RNA polymerase sigma factor [Blautia sp. MSJ-19]|uniref:RNA polymerase sigma factor n=1 Tax=Blautia sp. MSJ-19 TaxID=2841517 RepID=UPI001C0EEFB6|nr:sigma-70 family RNA polymerase sigma factor [Blautia sp. MSJ-19]MBU5482453.1 sigma-70 family RNA polymerase sigma factor [Blautia sp. MSJ-19]
MIIENFDDFYDEYQGFSAYIAFCMTGDKELSRDISQEVFISLFKLKDRLDYSNRYRLRKLVLKVTTNKCNDYFRKSLAKQRFCSIEDENGREIADERNNPEAEILRMEEAAYRKLVLEGLQKRNPMNYDILLKTKMHRMTAAEVASEYGITTNNVNNRNLRSKAWMIEEMEKLCRQSHKK